MQPRPVITQEKIDEVDRKLTRSIANLNEQFQQFRARDTVSTSSNSRLSNAEVDRLELLIKQSCQEFEAQFGNT